MFVINHCSEECFLSFYFGPDRDQICFEVLHATETKRCVWKNTCFADWLNGMSSIFETFAAQPLWTLAGDPRIARNLLVFIGAFFQYFDSFSFFFHKYLHQLLCKVPPEYPWRSTRPKTSLCPSLSVLISHMDAVHLYVRPAAVITNTVLCSSTHTEHPETHSVLIVISLLHLHTGVVYNPTLWCHPFWAKVSSSCHSRTWFIH